MLNTLFQGDDSVVACVFSGGIPSVEVGYNTGYNYQPLPNVRSRKWIYNVNNYLLLFHEISCPD